MSYSSGIFLALLDGIEGNIDRVSAFSDKRISKSSLNEIFKVDCLIPSSEK